MNMRLRHVEKWRELAGKVHWSAAALARRCEVSLRTLERYFLKEVGQSPKSWLAEERHRQAAKLLREGKSVKETSALLGYAHPTHFSRDYKGQLCAFPAWF